jgi:hypothetical protein
MLESISPSRNLVLIFPHEWPHAGGLVTTYPKITLRGELY